MSDLDVLEVGLCWGTLIDASLVELIDLAGRHGFPTLSVRPDTVLAEVEGGIGETALRRLLADAGVRVRVIDALCDGLPGMENRNRPVGAGAFRADQDSCFRAATAVEAPLVNVSLYGGKPVAREMLAEALGAAARNAARHGLGLVLEFVPDTAIPDLATARWLAEASGEANCRILLDPWHLDRSGGTVDDVRALPAGSIGSLQLDDRTPPVPGTPYVPMTGRDLPGEGRLPLHAIARAALANNPELTAELEVFSAELRALPLDAAAARIASSVAQWRAAT